MRDMVRARERERGTESVKQMTCGQPATLAGTRSIHDPCATLHHGALQAELALLGGGTWR